MKIINSSEHDNKAVFSITTEDVQEITISMLDRRLTSNEMRIAEKCIESGLTFGIETVFKAAIEEAVEQSTNLEQH